MQKRDEGNFDILKYLNEERRDREIHDLSAINLRMRIAGIPFVLTGSYSIEALTGSRLEHKDVDANIFSTDIQGDLLRADALIRDSDISQGQPTLYKKTIDRLEYDLMPVSGLVSPKRLEIQFVEVARALGFPQTKFCFESQEKQGVRIPTLLAELKDSKGVGFAFRVKSLSYTIASWAIRISGIAENPKRFVRQGDLNLFRLLLSRRPDWEDVILAMKHHPQMPIGVNPDAIFQTAMDVLKRK